MKKLLFYMGKLGSGKSHIAKEKAKELERMGYSTSFVEVSDHVRRFATKITGNPDPSRAELQAVKEAMKTNPRWLVDSLIANIESEQADYILVSGLRELPILEELEEVYGSSKITVVEAEPELRRLRRNLDHKQFEDLEARDNMIGLQALLDSVANRAEIIENNYEIDW